MILAPLRDVLCCLRALDHTPVNGGDTGAMTNRRTGLRNGWGWMERKDIEEEVDADWGKKELSKGEGITGSS